MSADVHSPTNAGPSAVPEASEPAPPPEQPSGASRPEVLAGAAFAGGFLAAILLRRLAG